MHIVKCFSHQFQNSFLLQSHRRRALTTVGLGQIDYCVVGACFAAIHALRRAFTAVAMVELSPVAGSPKSADVDLTFLYGVGMVGLLVRDDGIFFAIKTGDADDGC